MIEGRTVAALRFGAEAALSRSGPLTDREVERYAAWLCENPDGTFTDWLKAIARGEVRL